MLLLAAVSTGCSNVTHKTKSAQDKPHREARASKGRGYDVYLLIGQSNMAGRAGMQADDTTRTMQGVWLLNGDDVPEPARNPLNRYSTVRKDKNPNVYSNQKINPGTAFGETVAAATGRKVLLVVNAMGETSIEEWAKTAPVIGLSSSIGKGRLQLYSEAVRRCKEAMKYGKLKAIIWHQGEGNSNRVEEYPAQLAQLVSDLREDLGAPDVPFIAGELSYTRGKGSDEFNAMIRTISTFVDNSDWVSADGVSAGKDRTHFDRAGQLELGKRYADKVLEMCYPAKKSKK